MTNLERVVSIGSRESQQCSTNVIGAFQGYTEQAQGMEKKDPKFDYYFGSMSPENNKNVQDHSNMLSMISDDQTNANNSQNEFNNLMIKRYSKATKKPLAKNNQNASQK